MFILLRKSKGFTQPLQIPCRSPPPSESDEGDGFSISNMMSMMMMQSRMDAEQREWEYQLQYEEMVIMCEESRAQRKMMTIMMITMLQEMLERILATPHFPPSNNLGDLN